MENLYVILTAGEGAYGSAFAHMVGSMPFRPPMRWLVLQMMCVARFFTQFFGLSARHLAGIDESLNA
jgi:hypothetical protein